MLHRLLVTDDSKATAILRLVLGVVFFAHGAQKLLGWFGGPGFSGSMGLFTGYLHIPAPFAFLAIAAEFFGGLGLILGPHPNRRVRDRNEYGGRHCDGASRVRVLHELDRHAEG